MFGEGLRASFKLCPPASPLRAVGARKRVNSKMLYDSIMTADRAVNDTSRSFTVPGEGSYLGLLLVWLALIVNYNLGPSPCTVKLREGSLPT